MSNAHPLISFLQCPITKTRLSYIRLDDDALLSDGGIVYPIIDGVVVMKPIAPVVREKCAAFLSRNDASLRKLGNAFDLSQTQRVLVGNSGCHNPSWHEDEMAYWESVFCRSLNESVQSNPGWNRTLPRAEVLKRLPVNVHEQIVLEIGCGSTHTLFDVYGLDVPNYIGLDLSFHACVLARRVFPHGLFLQASAENPPIWPGKCDLIIAYGVLHHLPSHEENLPGLLSLLRPGGFLVGADPLMKPRIPRFFNFLSRSRAKDKGEYKIDLRSGMSPHNDWIDWDNLQHIIAGTAEVACSCTEYSVLRHLLIKYLYDGLGFRGKAMTQVFILADKFWLGTVGRFHRVLGPAGIQYALRKNIDSAGK